MDAAIRDTVGAMFVGQLLTMILYGITTLQAYFYFQHYQKDAQGLKLFVFLIWVLDTVHVAFVAHAIFFYLVDSYGNPAGLEYGTWSLFASTALNVLMALLSQCFYAQRIYQLSSFKIRKWLTSFIMVFVIAHFCFGIETVVEFARKKALSRLHEVTFIAVIPFASFAVLSDILVAATLCILLANNRSEFSDTNTLINKLIVYSINRCLLTTAVALAEVIMFAVNPNSFYTLAIDFVIGKLYANSVLAALNSRQSLRPKSRGDTTTSDMSTSFRVASAANANTADANGTLIRMGTVVNSTDRPDTLDTRPDSESKEDESKYIVPIHALDV